MKYLILGIITLLIFGSCEKRRTTVSGEVRNPITGEHYPNVEIKFYQQYATSLRDYGTVISDQNGYYEFSKILAGKNQLEAQIQTDFSSMGLIQLGFVDEYGGLTGFNGYELQLSVGDEVTADLCVTELAYVALDLTNVNCFDSSDRLSINGTYDFSPFESRSLVATNWGCGNLQEVKMIPQGTHYLSIEVTRNNVTTTSYDTIQVLAGDTLYYQLQY